MSMTNIRYGWMCGTDFDHELGECTTAIYSSKERLLEKRQCVHKDTEYSCSIVKVMIVKTEVETRGKI